MESMSPTLEWRVDGGGVSALPLLLAENTHAEREMAPLAPLRDRLYGELTGRISVDDASVPVRKDDYWYYVRQERERPHRVFCRKQESLDAPEEVVLDENALAGDRPYCAVRSLAVAPGHRLLAYAMDTCGHERLELWIADLSMPERPPVRLRRDVAGGLVWAADGRTLFYTVLDEANRPDRVYRHRVGHEPATDALVYHEPDEAFRLVLGKTESEAYLLCLSRSLDCTEIRCLNSRAPLASFRLLHPRRPGVRCALTHHGEHFYLLTNEEAPGFKVLRGPARVLEGGRWEELIPHRAGVRIERLEALGGHLVTYEREDGRRRIRLLDLAAGGRHEVALPEEASVVHAGDNREFTSRVLRFGYSSLTTPYSVCDYDMESRRLTVVKQTRIPGFRQEDYGSRRLVARGADGERIPISLVFREDLLRAGGNPLVLYGYGAYGHCVEPEFDPLRLSLLDRGVVYAIAHVRGGGEMGEDWHRQGRLLAKRNSVRDFIACAEHLIQEGYTTPDRLAAMGESAGGLLIGAVLNERPDLFSAAVLDCPFVDVLSALLDASLPLTAADWLEWGNPHEPEHRASISSYCPCENLAARPYPAILASAGLRDPRVPPQGPLRWVLRLRELTTSGRPVLLRVHLDAGHHGPAGRFDLLREAALKQAFLLRWLGVAPAL